MRVRYSPRAAEDLENIRRYIGKNSQTSAWVVASFIRQSIARLVQWPRSARMTDAPGVRRLVVTNYPYVVYYDAADDEVIVLTVLHSAQEG
jgi:addiction module RelE/StbE family toxin